jgi:hypothetical protein
MMISMSSVPSTSEYVSRRNRILGSQFLILGVLMVLIALISVSDIAALVIEMLIALECLWFGGRLWATSSIKVSGNVISYRTKYFRKRVVPIEDVLRIDRAERTLTYVRVFPRIILRNGQYCDLLPYETSKSRSESGASPVTQVISMLNQALTT